MVLRETALDFDYLASALAGRARCVVCPYLPCCGQSDRLSDSSDERVAGGLQRHESGSDCCIGVGRDPLGRELIGGLIGMVLAAIPGCPIRRLVIDDIGPYLPWAGLLRLGANLNEAPKSFETIGAAELYLRRVLASFGELEDEHWRHLTVHSVEWRPGRLHYKSLCDPGIAHAFRNPRRLIQRGPVEILGRDRHSYPGGKGGAI